MKLLRSRWIWRLILPILLAGAVLAWAGPDRTIKAMSCVPLLNFTLVVAGFLLVHIACALKWRFTLQGFGATLSTPSAVRAHGAGLAANLWLPTAVGGDVIRAAFAVREGTRSEALVLGSLIDRIADLIALLLLGMTGLVIRGDSSVGETSTAHVTMFACGLVGILMMGFFGAIRLRWTSLLPRRFRRSGLRLRVALRRVALWRLATTLALSMALQLTFLLMNRSLGLAMGTPDDLSAWLVAWPLAKVCAMTPLGLGGLGVREMAFASIAVPLGFPRDLAVSQSLLWQAVLMTGGLLAGLMCGFVMPKPKAHVA